MKILSRGCIWLCVSLCALLVACHGGGGSSANLPPMQQRISNPRHAMGSPGTPTPIVCDQTQAPIPSQGTSVGYTCFLVPNGTVTIDGQNSPYPINPFGYTCTPLTGVGPNYLNGATPPPFVTLTILPGSNSDTSCSRIDTATIRIDTDGTLLANSSGFPLQVAINGTYCTVDCTAGQKTETIAVISFVRNLHISDLQHLDSHSHPTFIEDQSVTRVAGQHMDLRADASQDINETVQGCTWTMPSYFANDALSHYATTAQAIWSSATPVPATPPPANATSVGWYPTKSEISAPLSIKCDVLEPDKHIVSLSASTQLAFQTPAPQPVMSYGAVSIYNGIQYPVQGAPCQSMTSYFLIYGDPCNAPGIKWTYNVTTNQDEAGGKIALWQIINFYHDWGNDDKGAPVSGTQYTNCADGNLPYTGQGSTGPVGSGQIWSAIDAPGMNLDPGNPPYYSYAHAFNTFDDYFMYAPPDSPGTGIPSIWISLGHIYWGMNAETSYIGTPPAPGQTPDPAGWSGPNVLATPKPTQIQDNNVATPTVSSSCQITG